MEIEEENKIQEEQQEQPQEVQPKFQFEPDFEYLDHYKLIQELGKGQYAKVYLTQDPKTGQRKAIKIFISQINQNEFLQEFRIIQDLQHQNLVNLVEIIENGWLRKIGGQIFQKTAIIIELAEQGDLFTTFGFFKRWPQKVSRTIFHQLINALEYLQQHNICHRDLKLENLLFDRDFNLKVADFGFARNDTGELYSYKGSGCYMAPEIINEKQYSGAAVDLYAAGVLLFTINVGSYPYNNDRKEYTVLQNDPNVYWKKFKNLKLSDDLKLLITNMLVEDPNLRFNIQQIKESQWYQGEILNQTELFEYLNQRNIAIQEAMLAQQQQQQQQQTNQGGAFYTGVGTYRSADNEIDASAEIQCLATDENSDSEIQFVIELQDVGNKEIKINIYKEKGCILQYNNNILNKFYETFQLEKQENKE